MKQKTEWISHSVFSRFGWGQFLELFTIVTNCPHFFVENNRKPYYNVAVILGSQTHFAPECAFSLLCGKIRLFLHNGKNLYHLRIFALYF